MFVCLILKKLVGSSKVSPDQNIHEGDLICSLTNNYADNIVNTFKSVSNIDALSTHTLCTSNITFIFNVGPGRNISSDLITSMIKT